MLDAKTDQVSRPDNHDALAHQSQAEQSDSISMEDVAPAIAQNVALLPAQELGHVLINGIPIASRPKRALSTLGHLPGEVRLLVELTGDLEQHFLAPRTRIVAPGDCVPSGIIQGMRIEVFNAHRSKVRIVDAGGVVKQGALFDECDPHDG